MRDVDRRDREPALDPLDLGPHLHAQLRVEVGERLVHQECLRLAHDRPPHRDALALPTGELARLTAELLFELEEPGDVLHPVVDLVLRQPPQPERKGEVVVDRLVRVERVGLEDHGDVAIARRHGVDDLLADPDLALADLLQSGDHPQRGRLAAAGGPDEDHQLAVADLEVEGVHGDGAVRIDLPDPIERDLGHRGPKLYDGVPSVHVDRHTV